MYSGDAVEGAYEGPYKAVQGVRAVDRNDCHMRNIVTGECPCMGRSCQDVCDDICLGLHQAYLHGKFVGAFLKVHDVFPEFRKKMEEREDVKKDD